MKLVPSPSISRIAARPSAALFLFLLAAVILAENGLANPIIDLGNTVVYGINNNGYVVGNGASGPFLFDGTNKNALPLPGYLIRGPGSPPQFAYPVAYAINDDGLVVGGVTVIIPPLQFEDPMIGTGPTGFADFGFRGCAIGASRSAVIYQSLNPHFQPLGPYGGALSLSTLERVDLAFMPTAINASNTIVGNLGTGGYFQEGLGGSPTKMSVPLSVMIQTTQIAPFGINSAGTIVGFILGGKYGIGRNDTPVYGGFIWTNYYSGVLIGSFGGVGGQALAINDPGQIVGWTYDTNLNPRAFIATQDRPMEDGVLPPIDLNTFLPPGSGWALTNAIAINSHGQIIGQGLLNGQPHAYALSVPPQAVYYAPVIQAGPASTSLSTGSTLTLSATVNGLPTPFLQWQKNGTNIPGANGATLSIQNVQLSDSGSYVIVATNSAGHAASDPAVVTINDPPGPQRILDLGAHIPLSVNDFGHVVGPDFVYDGVFIRPVTDYIDSSWTANIDASNSSKYPPTAAPPLAYAINAADHFVGAARYFGFSNYGDLDFVGAKALIFDVSSKNLVQSTDWFFDGGSFVSVNGLDTAMSLNASDGLVIDVAPVEFPHQSHLMGLLLTNVDLSSINNSGVAVGTVPANYGSPATPSRAVVFSAAGTEADVDPTLLDSEGFAINDAGDIAGSAGFPGGVVSHAFLNVNGISQDLGSFGASTDVYPYGFLGGESAAYSVNNHRQVVGNYYTYPGTSAGRREDAHPFIWQNGVMTDLNDLLPSDSGWKLVDASQITDKGYIIGNGVFQGATHGYRLALAGLPPLIAPLPTNLNRGSGTPLQLQASVFGPEPLHLQWMKDGTNLPAQTNALLSITNLALSDSGNYRLVAANDFGQALSTGASVAVIDSFSLHLSAIGLSLAITGTVGETYRIDYVSHLGDTPWQVLLPTLTLTNSSQSIPDPASSGAATRFYRAVRVQ